MNAIASLKIFLFSFFVLCLLSCRPGFDLVHLQAPPAQKEQLPRLVLEMGGSSFANLYPLPREIREQDMESGEISYRLDFKDQVRYQDVKTIFERTLP